MDDTPSGCKTNIKGLGCRGVRKQGCSGENVALAMNTASETELTEQGKNNMVEIFRWSGIIYGGSISQKRLSHIK